MHATTYDFFKPSDKQVEVMNRVRKAAADYSAVLEAEIPDGPDKTYLLRKLREVAMWANVAVTRQPDGEPRK